MPSQISELLYAGKLVEHLRWPGHVHAWESDPPDVIVSLRGDRLVAVEVRELYGDETRSGSPDREFMTRCHRLLSGIRDIYYSQPNVQRLNVRAVFSQRPKSRSLRRLTPAELAADETELCNSALKELLTLPPLARGDTHPFKVTPKHTPTTFFRATAIPDGDTWADLAMRWSASPGAGWTRHMASAALQEIVDGKSEDLNRYQGNFVARVLLLGAYLSGPGTYVDLPPDSRIDPRGFDAVFFVRYFDAARCIGGSFIP
jgi:hypothetical protein